MRQFTLKHLEQMCACQSQVDLFRNTFGERANVTYENIEKAIDVGLDIEFVVASINPGWCATHEDLYKTFWEAALEYDCARRRTVFHDSYPIAKRNLVKTFTSYLSQCLPTTASGNKEYLCLDVQ